MIHFTGYDVRQPLEQGAKPGTEARGISPAMAAVLVKLFGKAANDG